MALASGTAALHLALLALGVGRGDEVICSTFTFAGSAFPITYPGATPVFVDSEPRSWNMDPTLPEQALTDRIGRGTRPKAVIVVHAGLLEIPPGPQDDRCSLLAPVSCSYNSHQGGPSMSSVGVRELKNRLTEYLRRTKRGEEIIVTERGQPIALLQAIQSAQRPVTIEARLARLAAQGRLTLPTRKPLKRLCRVTVRGTPLSRMILDDRR